MRLGRKYLTDHDFIGGQTADDHHNQGVSFPITVNSQAIAGFATYSLNIALGKTGYQVVHAVLRGTQLVEIQGYTGDIVIAANSATLSTSWAESYSGYTYMGVHSRLHGDSYLSYQEYGASSIRLKDAYISGSNAVFEFYNANASSRNLTVYGLLVAK